MKKKLSFQNDVGKVASIKFIGARKFFEMITLMMLGV
jgi:hypothetical protein